MIAPRSSWTSRSYRSRSGPASRPSRSIEVTSNVVTPASARRSSASATSMPPARSSTSPARPRCPSRTSIATAIRSAPWVATSGRPARDRAAPAVPSTARAAPAASAAVTAAIVRRPPGDLDPAATRRPPRRSTRSTRSVSRPPRPGAVEVDHVEPACTVRGEPPRDRDRIVAVGRLALEVTLAQADHPTARAGRSPAGSRSRLRSSCCHVTVLARYYATTREDGAARWPTTGGPRTSRSCSTRSCSSTTSRRRSASSAICARSPSCTTWPSAGRWSASSTAGCTTPRSLGGPARARRRSPGSPRG